MGASKAQQKATEKWQKKAYFKALVRFKAERESEIRKFAGDSLNGFIVEAVEEKIARMKKNDV
jgi:hypothetical protein